VTTVSPRYAREIQTPEFGCGLEGVVQTRAGDIAGLLNGIDTKIWNPARDRLIPANYSAADLAGKRACRAELLRRAGLDPAFAGPVFGMVCRFTEQKGVDLVLANADFFQRHDARLVILGSGDPALERAARETAAGSGGRIALTVRQDEHMSHLIEAGADFFVMPSRFEPCGLNQMYSLAYGTLPLAGRVGGLADTITDLGENPARGTGFLFAPTTDGLRDGLERARRLFADRPALAAAQARGMAKNFSWATAAQAYERLYEEAV
jgi:starch synthase